MRPARLIPGFGTVRTIRQWAEEFGIRSESMSRLIKLGRTVEEVAASLSANRGRTYTHQGKTLTVRQWADELDLEPLTVYNRLKKYPVEVALQPGRLNMAYSGHPTKITIDGVTRNLVEWAAHIGVTYSTIWRHAQNGKTTEEAIRHLMVITAEKKERRARKSAERKARRATHTPRGVASDFEGSKGTGGGRHLQETPEITFSNKDEDR